MCPRAGRRAGPVVAVVLAWATLLACAGGEQSTADNRDGEEAVVVRVIDGDTFDAELAGGSVERIRIPQVDAPERDECGYDDATAALADLVLDAPVHVSITADGPARDPHGRLLRIVRLDDADVGEALIRSGFARWGRHYADEDTGLAARYEDAETEARDAAHGLWSECGWRAP